MTCSDVSEIIARMVLSFGKAPRDINNGMCEDFALSVVRELMDAGELGALVVDVTWFDEEWNDDFKPWHAWVYLDGRWYDAEAPHGVDDWEDLPFFKSWREDGIVPKRSPGEAARVAETAELNRRIRGLQRSARTPGQSLG